MKGGELRLSAFFMVGFSVPVVIRMPGTNGKGAIDLFGGYDSSQLMRQGDSPESNGKAGTMEGFGRPAVGRTYGYDDLLDATILNTPQGCGKFLGGHLFPPAVGQNEIRRRSPSGTIEVSEQGGFRHKLPLLTGNIPAGALNIALEELGVGLRGGRAPRSNGCK